MTGEDLSKYRKRTEGDSAGLERVERKRAGPGGSLTIDKFEAPAGAGSLVIVSIADQMRPVEDAAAALPDFGIGLLVSQQQSERVRELLERAGDLISGGQYRQALPVVEEALAADRGSGAAWALKGRCLSQLGYHEAALRVLQYAREQVSDPEIRIVILKLEADCIHASTRVLEEKLVQVVGNNRMDEALEVVREGLIRQPSNIVFLYHLANLYWLRGENEAARQIVEEACRHVGGDSVDFIAELERKLEFGPHWKAMEAARLALRRADSATAFAQLDACADVLRDNEQYVGLRAYAERKRRSLGQLMGTKGPAVSTFVQQQIMRWVLREELREADSALGTGDHDTARQALEVAVRIEPDCAAVCFKLARAIFSICGEAVENSDRDRPRNAGDALKTAETLVRRASADDSYRERANALLKEIGALRGRMH